MSLVYYYNDGENEVGPFSLAKLRTLRESGFIGDGTLVRGEDAGSWTPFSRLPATAEPELAGGPWGRRGAAMPREAGAVGLEADPRHARAIAEPVRIAGADPATGAGPAPLVFPAGWLAHPPTPWRRYAARMLDTTVNGVCGFLLIGVAFYAAAPSAADSFFSILDTGAGPLLDLLMTAAVASLIGGALIGVSGFTLGKLIFGIKVTRLDGGKLGLRAGVTRDLSVLLKGLGLGIPLVALVTIFLSYRRLTDRGVTSWDEGRYAVRHRPAGAAQYLLNAVGLALIVLAGFLARALAEL